MAIARDPLAASRGPGQNRNVNTLPVLKTLEDEECISLIHSCGSRTHSHSQSRTLDLNAKHRQLSLGQGLAHTRK